MVYIGKHVMSQVLCGDCGNPISNCMEGSKSAFIIGSCQKPECESYGIGVTVERSSMQIVAMSPCYMVDGKKAFPVLVFEDGNPAWPKPQVREIRDKDWNVPKL
jgi:hypothetical protein